MEAASHIRVLFLHRDAPTGDSIVSALRGYEHIGIRFDAQFNPQIWDELQKEYDLLLIEQEQLVQNLEFIKKQVLRVPILAFGATNTRVSSGLMSQLPVEGWVFKEYLEPGLIVRSMVHAMERHRLWGKVDVQVRRTSPLYDLLTELPESLLFFDRIHQAMASHRKNKKQCALMIFKFSDEIALELFNDPESHPKIMRQIAKKLSGCIQPPDSVGRLPNHEFGVLMNEIKSTHEVAKASQIILRVLSEPMIMNQKPFFLKPAAGIALYPEDAADYQTLIGHAQVALEQANQENQGTSFFHFPAQVDFFKQLKMERELRVSWVRGDFSVQYHPIVCTKNRELFALKANLFWKAPFDLSGKKFETVCEETGLSKPLSDWLLRASLRHYADWIKKTKAFENVNLIVPMPSTILFSKEFKEKIIDILKMNEFPKNKITFLVPEREIRSFEPYSSTLAEDLRKLHLGIATSEYASIDSCPSFLRTFPSNFSFFDENFVKTTMENPCEAHRMKCFSKIIETEEKKVVATGIENKEQMLWVHEQGNDLMQGGFFSKPLEEKECPDLLTRVW